MADFGGVGEPHSWGAHGSVGDRAASGGASPSSLLPLERAGSSSEDEELPELEEIDGGNAHDGQSEAPAPAEEPAQAPRQSQRAAAQRATARISAALHSGGMADLDGAWWGARGTVSTRPSASATASGAGSDDKGATAAASRARRRAGPVTTGEESSEPSPTPLRRSARKRNAAASHLAEGPEDAPKVTKRAAGPKTTGEDVQIKNEVPRGDAKKEEENAESCCICLDVPGRYELSSVNGCEHLYCFSCIEKWADRENTCPQCKTRFTKIERVHRPPPNKRRKRGESAGDGESASGDKNSKKVKNRDQRADVSHGNPLQGLFATMEANGTMPHSIAQFIFSGLGGTNGGLMGGAPRRLGGAAFAGRPPARASRPSGVDPFHPHQVPEPLNALVRGLSSNIDGVPAGARTVAAASSAPPLSHQRRLLSLSDSWVRGGASLASSSSRAAAGSPVPPHLYIQRGGRQMFDSFRRGSSGSSGEDTDDNYEYSNFVQRVQRSAAGRAGQPSASSADRFAIGGGGAGGGGGIVATRAVPTSGGPGSSAANALEIDDDSDDDEVIEVIEVPHD